MKRLYISSLVPKSTLSILSGMGFVLSLLPPCKALPTPISSHADMLLYYDNELIVTKEYFDDNNELFDNPSVTKERLGCNYPDDILFNCFALNNTLFGKLECLSEKVRKKYNRQIDVKQGYAKCSTVVMVNAIITADSDIFAKVNGDGFAALKITPGHILLPGYDYGFIGGASLVFEDSIFFFGDVTAHPDYTEIAEFLSGRGYEITYDKNYPLTDFGGGIFA